MDHTNKVADLLKKRVLISIVMLFCYSCQSALADGFVVSKVYHPYVLPLEQAFEWRLMSRQSEGENKLAQRLGYGQSVSENLMIEVYLIGDRDGGDDYGLQAYEIETRWMLTEQGQYWADWGLLFEIEKDHQIDSWEASTAVLFEKGFEKTSLTLNLLAIYQWGKAANETWQSEFRLNYRYRWIPQMQPAIEIHLGKGFAGIGPAIVGIQRFDRQKQLKWEAGFFSEITHSGKDHTFRFSFEYEF